MNQRELERINHYCKKLNLNRWDTKDITEYIVKHYKCLNSDYSSVIYDDFDKIRTKICRLGIKNIVDEFERYLELETTMYEEISTIEYKLSENEIWKKVYNKIDGMIEEEINYAKEMSRQERSNKGCSVTILIIIASTLFASYFFV